MNEGSTLAMPGALAARPTAPDNRLTPDPGLLDLGRIEGLRGPRGTPYGVLRTGRASSVSGVRSRQ